jgi:hypothetical protein
MQELRERYKREPWGSRAKNRNDFYIIEMLRRICRSTGWKDLTYEDVECMNQSKTIDYVDDICDLMQDVNAKPWDVAPGSSSEMSVKDIEESLDSMSNRFGK